MKRKIYTIGETVYDIIFKNGEIVAGKAGGSMLNASVSLGRAGAEVAFISEIGNDHLGKTILHFLGENKVETSFIQLFDKGKTPLALAFLDEKQNASYSFYKQYPEKRLQQRFPDVSKNDMVLFGSFFAVNPEVRLRVTEFIMTAKKAGALIIYDPNIRHPHTDEKNNLMKAVEENFALADLVRASHEDFKVLFDCDKPEAAAEIIAEYSDAHLLYTQDARFVFHARGNQYTSYHVPKINVVSSIGAGDNFNAGIMYALLQNDIYRNELNAIDGNTWQKIVESGINFSQKVCKSYENYIPKGFINKE